jgi:hypothetical protein
VVAFDRSTFGDQVNAINGHYYVVESLNGDFTVQNDEFTVAEGVNNNTLTLTTTAPMAKTFLFGSYKTDGDTGWQNKNFPYLELLDEDTLRLFRRSLQPGVTLEVYTVTFNAGGAEKVQRGILAQTVITASENIPLSTPVGTQSTSMASIPASTCFKHGTLDSGGASSVPDVMCDLVFFDDETLTLQHSIEGSNETCDWSWQVIEWELSAGGPARRVMVR